MYLHRYIFLRAFWALPVLLLTASWMPYLRQIPLSQLLLNGIVGSADKWGKCGDRAGSSNSETKQTKPLASTKRDISLEHTPSWKIEAFCYNCICEGETYGRFMSVLCFWVEGLFHNINPALFFHAFSPSPNITQLWGFFLLGDDVYALWSWAEGRGKGSYKTLL